MYERKPVENLIENQIQDMPERMTLESLDIAAEKREQLKQLFPEVFNEDKVDFERLQRVLGEQIDTGRERYGLTWPGKAECMKVIQEPSRATLKPCREESVNFDDTENLFIEGDNLEVLKLLQKSYCGKVKMIYIDPPYNTGKEFIYPDNFQETIETYLAYAGLVDASGKKFTTNTATEGRFHSKWLNMMYPRLYLAKNLLREDGVMFISIDDNELQNLRRICDEVFGEENFVGNIIWQKKFARQNDATYFSNMHDNILCYAKQAKSGKREKIGWNINLLPRTDEDNQGYSNPDNDPRGSWTSVVLSARSGTNKLVYKIVTPGGRECWPPEGRYWSVNQDKLQQLIAENRIWFGKEGNNTPRLKTFLSEVQSGLVPNSMWFHDEVGHNQGAKQSLKKLFEGMATFDTPKPTELLKRIIYLSSNCDGDICLDFFAGSSATAHAVMELCKEDGIKRK